MRWGRCRPGEVTRGGEGGERDDHTLLREGDREGEGREGGRGRK